jgi:lipopolysaccharide transport system ATP-binding protein
LADGLVSPFHRVGKLWRGQATGAAEREEPFWALQDVSFEAKHGEVVGIIGRNGAGKSTLLKILSRITEPTEGYAALYGRVGSLLEVGTGFHAELTGRENVYLNGAILGMRRAEIARRFDEIIAFAEIEQFIDTPVKHYSSGMYLRLAFAVAAHLEPEILLVDEVLAVGDAAFQRKCLGKVGDVVKEGRTVLFVSHNMPAVLNLCQRAMLLESGRIKYQGQVTEAADRYLATDRQHNLFLPAHGEQVGDQRARIENFEVRPNPPRTGMPIEFIFTLSRNGSGNSGLLAELAVTFMTVEGTRLLHIHSRHMGCTFAIPLGIMQVTATLDSLPLAPGRYPMNVWLGAGDTPIHWLRHCFVLSVEPGGMKGGDFIQSSHGPVVVPSVWYRGV